ncbi:Protein AAGR-1 [Aphelenchoides avenae]|nr:Protein AAGR-1 [Aphelenchus avenae]
MWAEGSGPDSYNPNTKNLYSVHPFYMAIEEDGKAHGVFIFNSNAQEVTLGPAPHLVYRTIGGQLDIFYFPGPTPEQVVQQYQQVIGTPFLPAYFALGFQICRYGYKNLDDMKATVKRIQDHGIPLDVTYADIDYMDHYKDFTLDPTKWGQFPEYAKWLHDNGLRLFLIFDPAIEVDYDTFKRGLEQKARFVEWPNADMVPKGIENKYPLLKGTKIMLGVVWPAKHAAFPDFLDPTNTTKKWWISEFVRFHNTLPFDGIWVDMNEPSNFGTDGSGDPHPGDAPLSCPLSGNASYYDKPPFETASSYQWGSGRHLCTNTLCMVGTTGGGGKRFYDTKNLYGYTESVSTYAALGASTGKRGAVISR